MLTYVEIADLVGSMCFHCVSKFDKLRSFKVVRALPTICWNNLLSASSVSEDA